MKQNKKVPKSAKTKLSDLTPKKDTRGGKYPDVGRTPPISREPVASTRIRHYTL
jgi:hypothetical protein